MGAAAADPGTKPINILVLGAQRPGKTDPLAAARGVSHKCLIPLGDRPLLTYVMTTLLAHDRVADIGFVIERSAFDDVRPVIDTLEGSERVTLVPAADNLTDSVMAGMAVLGDAPTMITTADNALLTRNAVTAMHDTLTDGDSDVALGLATKEAVQGAHPLGQRRYYEFSDGGYSNCNLYGISGQAALGAAEIFRGGGQFAKKKRRIVGAFGLVNLALLKFSWISLDRAMRRISKRIGLRVRPVVLHEGRNAIDVDDERSYAITAKLLDVEAR